MEPEGSLPHSQEPAICPYSEPDQSSPKSHVPFPLLRLYQRISPTPKQLWMYGIMAIFLRWRVLSTSPNPQAGWPPLVGCPQPLIQYVRSYPPYWVGRNSLVGIGTRYGLDGPGIESRWRLDFLHPSRPAPGAHLAFYTRDTGSFPGVELPRRSVDHPPPSNAEGKERL